MRLTVFFLTVSLMVFISFQNVLASPKGSMMQEESASMEVGNTICPVSKENIAEGKEVKYEYNGKIYNFCCKMCIKDFQKDPEKYIKVLSELTEGQHPESHSDHSH